MLSDPLFSFPRANFFLHGIAIFDSVKIWCPVNGYFSWYCFRFLVYFCKLPDCWKKGWWCSFTAVIVGLGLMFSPPLRWVILLLHHVKRDHSVLLDFFILIKTYWFLSFECHWGHGVFCSQPECIVKVFASVLEMWLFLQKENWFCFVQTWLHCTMQHFSVWLKYLFVFNIDLHYTVYSGSSWLFILCNWLLSN